MDNEWLTETPSALDQMWKCDFTDRTVQTQVIRPRNAETCFFCFVFFCQLSLVIRPKWTRSEACWTRHQKWQEDIPLESMFGGGNECWWVPQMWSSKMIQWQTTMSSSLSKVKYILTIPKNIFVIWTGVRQVVGNFLKHWLLQFKIKCRRRMKNVTFEKH